MNETNNVTKSIAHTKWNCKYHIVFAPKYRRKVFFEEKRLEIREILRTLCAWKGVDIIEGEICPDHVHLLLLTSYFTSATYFLASSVIPCQSFSEIFFLSIILEPKPKPLIPTCKYSAILLSSIPPTASIFK